MENYLKRVLNSGEVVHHIDGNKENNDVDNLDVMSVSEYNKCHGAAAANELLVELFNDRIIKYNRRTKRYERSC